MSKIKLEYISVGGRITGVKSDEEARKLFKKALIDMDFLMAQSFINDQEEATNFRFDDLEIEDSDGTWYSMRAVFVNEKGD